MARRGGTTAKILLAIAPALFAGGVEAQGRAGVFIDVQRTDPIRTTAAAPAGREDQRLVRIDHGVLTAARADATRGVGRMTLNLDDGQALEAIVERTAPTTSGYSLSGRIASASASAMTWVANGELVMGTIWTPAAIYEIVPVAGGVHAIRQVDQSADRPLGEPLKAVVDADFDPRIAEARKDDGSVVDVLVLWTPAARAAAGGEDEIRTAIDHYVAFTNDALRHSSTTLRIALVGQQEVAYAEVPDESGMDLERLRDPTDGYMDDIHARRDALGADLVSLITDNTDVGGIAYRMDSLHIGFGSHAFSVVTYTRSFYFAARSFAHELGHNMSLAHDRFVTPDGALYPFGHGYVNAKAFAAGAADHACWRTIMAYARRCSENDLRPETVPYFSTPRQRYPDADGELLGVPKTHDVEGPDGPADAVLALEQVRHVVANFRAEHTDDGDTLATATAIAASSATFAELHEDGDDVDFFRVALPQAGSLRVETTGNVDTTGTLMREGGSVLAEDDDSGAGPNFLIERDLDAGVYFIKVEGFGSDSTGSYALLTSFHAASDADDHGNTLAAATAITSTASADVSLDGMNDVDYLRFELTERGVLEAQTTGSVDTVGTLGRADDEIRFTYHQSQRRAPPHGGAYAGGGIVETNAISDDDSGSGGNFKIVGKFDAGSYFMAVRGWNDSQGATTLNLSFDASPDDHGDSAATATAITLPAPWRCWDAAWKAWRSATASRCSRCSTIGGNPPPWSLPRRTCVRWLASGRTRNASIPFSISKSTGIAPCWSIPSSKASRTPAATGPAWSSFWRSAGATAWCAGTFTRTTCGLWTGVCVLSTTARTSSLGTRMSS